MRQTATASMPAADSCLRGGDDARLVERLDHAAVGSDALGHLQAMPARDERLGLVPGQVEHVGHADAADLQHVAEAAGGDETGPGAGALEEGVGADGGAVQHLLDAGGVEVELLEQGGDARHHGAARIVRRRGDLALAQDPVARHDDDVRERTPDIDRNPHASLHFPRRPLSSGGDAASGHRRCQGTNHLISLRAYHLCSASACRARPACYDNIREETGMDARNHEADLDAVIVGAGLPACTCCTGCAGSASRRACWRRAAASAARGTGTAIRARAATLRACSTPTSSPTNCSSSGTGPSATPRSPSCCATPTTSPIASTSSATSTSIRASSRRRSTRPRGAG